MLSTARVEPAIRLVQLSATAAVAEEFLMYTFNVASPVPIITLEEASSQLRAVRETPLVIPAAANSDAV